MRWIYSLERRLGHLAVPGLMRIVVAFNALIFLMLLVKPDFVDLLYLQPDLVLKGQVWRLVTFVFIPPVEVGSITDHPLAVVWAFFYLNFLWLMGEGLEQAWGSFRLNLFYLLGIIGTAIAALCLNVVDETGVFLNLSLFFAFATLFPNYPVLLFFVLPVRVKWIAFVSLGLAFIQFVMGTITSQLAILVSLVNYLIFFGPEWVRYAREHGKIVKRQQKFQVVQKVEPEETLHHCKVCGRTELTAPELEFRVAGDGEEYCVNHLPSRRLTAEMPPPLPR
jgi:hypothetical protein